MAKVRPYLLALLAALLLFAQHSALTHAVWHLGHGGPAHATEVAVAAPDEHHHHGDHEHANRLCDFDAMLGQLLAGGAIATGTAVPVTDELLLFLPEGRPLAALAVLQPRSRGPPLIL